MLTRGSSRPSQAGSHQAALPISTMTAGTSRQRTRVASMAMATAKPTPNCFTVGSPLRMKLVNTQTMISAAEVITRPVEARPSMTAFVGLPSSFQCSWIWVSRNTS